MSDCPSPTTYAHPPEVCPERGRFRSCQPSISLRRSTTLTGDFPPLGDILGGPFNFCHPCPTHTLPVGYFIPIPAS